MHYGRQEEDGGTGEEVAGGVGDSRIGHRLQGYGVDELHEVAHIICGERLPSSGQGVGEGKDFMAFQERIKRERFLKQRPAPANTVRLAVRPARRPRRVPSRSLLRPLKWKKKLDDAPQEVRAQERHDGHGCHWTDRIAPGKPTTAQPLRLASVLQSSWIQRKKRRRSIMRSWGFSRASLVAGVLLALTPTAAFAHSPAGIGVMGTGVLGALSDRHQEHRAAADHGGGIG